jgi:hypothetical protein
MCNGIGEMRQNIDEMEKRPMQYARDNICNGIGEMNQNIDEMAKKTDAICIWVLEAMRGIHV